jgi:hypothetical protein
MALKLNTGTWRNFEVEVAGAFFVCKAFNMDARLAFEHVRGELAVLGNMDFYKMSRASQRVMIETVLSNVIDWRGVVNEHGAELTFEPELIDRFLPPLVLMQLYFRMGAEAQLTEDQRKNLSTASKSVVPAPAISIADGASNSVPTPAANPAGSVTAMAAA